MEYANEIEFVVCAVLIFKFIAFLVVLNPGPICDLLEVLWTVYLYKNRGFSNIHSEVKS